MTRQEGQATGEMGSSAGLWGGTLVLQATLALTLLVYALVQFLYVTATPLQEIALPDNLPAAGNAPRSLLVGIGPDEKEHFLYILSLAERGEVPAPSPDRRAAPAQYVSYQAQHPPLFYAVAALIYKATKGLGPPAVWYLLRGACALCGMAVIAFAARAARIAFPEHPLVALAAAPFVAFLPIFGHITGNLSNEPPAMVLGAWAWLQIARIARAEASPTVGDMARLGGTLGLAALTRLTALLWLPAVLIALVFAAPRGGKVRLLPLVVFAVCFAGLLAPWLVRNQVVWGTPVVRTFDRPLLQGVTLGEYLANPEQPIQPRGFPQPIVVTPLDTALWYAATAWLPFWLVQFYLPPAGVQSAPAWQALFLLLDAFALVSLFFHASRVRRRMARRDPAGRALLWAAGSALGFCVLVLIQQQLWVDWNVIYSAGRYLVAAAPASAVLFLFAVSAWIPSARGQRVAAGMLAVVLLAFDLNVALLVRRFYAEHPTQPVVQRIESR